MGRTPEAKLLQVSTGLQTLQDTLVKSTTMAVENMRSQNLPGNTMRSLEKTIKQHGSSTRLEIHIYQNKDKKIIPLSYCHFSPVMKIKEAVVFFINELPAQRDSHLETGTTNFSPNSEIPQTT
jgi:hypothetical protein